MRALFSPFLSSPPCFLSPPSLDRVHSADRLSLVWRLQGKQQAAGKQQRGGGMCADGNRWWFTLEACWATSTPHVPFCLTIAVQAGVARPSSGDRWSLLEKGHSTVLSVHGAPLEQPRTNAVSFCWEHTGASVCET